MFELRIFDLRHDFEALVPFSVFIKVLLQVFGQDLCGEWSIFRGADGYGETVCGIADSLDARDHVVVNPAELLPVLLLGVEYFDNVRIQPVGTKVEFGVHDSAFYYVRGDRDVLEKVAGYFTKVQIQ
jgi:hypothetical protein